MKEGGWERKQVWGEESCEITAMEEEGAITRESGLGEPQSFLAMTWGFEKARVVCCASGAVHPWVLTKWNTKAEVSHGGIPAYWSTGLVLFCVEDEVSSRAAVIMMADNL